MATWHPGFVDAGLAPTSRLGATAWLSFTFPTLPPGENDA